MEINKNTSYDDLISHHAELAVARGIDVGPTKLSRKDLIAEIERLEALPPTFSESVTAVDELSTETVTEGADEGAGGDATASEPVTEGSNAQAASDASVIEPAYEGSSARAESDASVTEPVTEGSASQIAIDAPVTEPVADGSDDLVRIHPLCSIRAEYHGRAFNIPGDQPSAMVPRAMANDLVAAGYASLLNV